MKKKILFGFAAVALFAVSFAFSGNMFNQAQAKDKINPECPNGCNDNGDGCYCYGWYKHSF